MNKLYHSFSDLIDFKSPWNILAKKAGNPLLTYEWFYAAAQAFHDDDKLYIFFIFSSGKPVAIAPLYQKKISGKYGRLSIIGDNDLAEPTSLIYKDNESLKELIQFIKSKNIACLFNRIPSNIRDDLEVSSKFDYSHFINSNGSQFLDNVGDFSIFESSLSSKRKSDLRRAYKKLNSYDSHFFRIFKPTFKEINETLKIAFNVENAGWKGQNNSSITNNRKIENFITRLFESNSDNVSTIGLLYVNDKVISCNLALNFEHKLWFIKIGYLEEYKKCSPGILLTHEMIRYCGNNNIKSLEFLGSSEKWINLWRPNERNYMTFLYYPVSYSGLIAFKNDFLYMTKRKISRILTKKG